MHIIRMDIDRKNSAEHLQIGPLGCGMNAIYATTAVGNSTMKRFIRGLLFRGQCVNELSDDDEAEAMDGSLQWADATGHVRLMSYAGGSPLLPSRFVHSPLHPSERHLHAEDCAQLRGLGNIFWEGDEHDGRWDDLRGEILGMIFCSSLGTVSPEKLWWAATRLGVHSAARSEPDEGYKRLNAEELELLERLRNSEAVDHDRAWWSIERDRIASELTQVQEMNRQASLKAVRCCQPCSPPENERLVSIQLEIARLRAFQQESLMNEANAQLHEHRDSLHAPTNTTHFKNVSLHNAAFGKTKAVHDRAGFIAERQRLQHKIEQLMVEQAGLDSHGHSQGTTHAIHSAKTRDEVPLRQQHAHAEEMLNRWDRRAQVHRRLAEVQSHLKTRSQFRRTTEGSLIPAAEKVLRELTSGSARQLPPWAIEASYRKQEGTANNAVDHRGEMASRSEYDNRNLPSENTRQRKLVDLAIRLAIAQAAVPRIGRIPLLLDESLSGFRGEALEQILHVLSAFSRDGRQLLISSSDEYVAGRVAAHGGSVSRMVEVMRYARPSYVLYERQELGMYPAMGRSEMVSSMGDLHPLRIVRRESPEHEILELNRQLTGIANEQATLSWWLPNGTRRSDSSQAAARPEQAVGGRRFYLQVDSPIQEAPGVSAELMRRMNSGGIYRIGDLLRVSAENLGAMIRVDSAVLEQIQRASELMCGTPQLRAFDAQVLVGCGITRSDSLRNIPATELVHRVESFLTAAAGQDLLRGATSFEVARIRNWLSDMRRSFASKSHQEVVPIRAERNRVRDQAKRIRRESSDNARPRIVRPNAVNNRNDRTAPFSVSNASTQRRSDQEFARDPRTTRNGESRNGTARTGNSRRAVSANAANDATSTQWKFYLDIESPIVDAPSIGPKMAERLAPFNIVTVGDLVAIQAENVANQLADRAVSSETVQQWQNQALLVCRIPNLRGHDAQLIVGCGLQSAEQLAASDPVELFNKVIRFASSKQGVRILRGSTVPDQDEVVDWIQWAQNCRAVRAA